MKESGSSPQTTRNFAWHLMAFLPHFPAGLEISAMIKKRSGRNGYFSRRTMEKPTDWEACATSKKKRFVHCHSDFIEQYHVKRTRPRKLQLTQAMGRSSDFPTRVASLLIPHLCDLMKSRQFQNNGYQQNQGDYQPPRIYCHLSSSGYSGGAVPELHRDSLSQWRIVNRTPATTWPCGHILILYRLYGGVK
jgi:hypothetical protein